MSLTSPSLDDSAPGPCCPRRMPNRRHAAASFDPDDRHAGTREPPQLLLYSDPAWRTYCESAVGKIPAGFTYVTQLLGHDLGNSVDAMSVPFAVDDTSPTADKVRRKTRINLIAIPATLETIYGLGPDLTPFLYEPETLLFRVVPTALLSSLFTVTPLSDPNSKPFEIRALYDERNRDTIMLHELAVVWMQFHNRCARQLMRAELAPFEAFSVARAHCVQTWHDIIREDILKHFIHPDIAGVKADPVWVLTEPTLLAGLFRAFHAMPLSVYEREPGETHNLVSLMKESYETSNAERSRWFFEWEFFLGAKVGGPRTGISASISRGLNGPTMGLPALDLNNAKTAYPNRLGSEGFDKKLAALPGEWRNRISAKQLSDDFNARMTVAPFKLTEDNLTWGPLYFALMIEAQLYGHNGGLGPFGSALFKTSVEAALDRARTSLDVTTFLSKRFPASPTVLPTAKTMLELINKARETNS